jgi:hypothetical protein
VPRGIGNARTQRRFNPLGVNTPPVRATALALEPSRTPSFSIRKALLGCLRDYYCNVS